MALTLTVIEQMRAAGWRLTREIPNAQVAEINLTDPDLIETPTDPEGLIFDKNPIVTVHFFENTDCLIPSFAGRLPWELNQTSANSITLAVNANDVLTIGRNDSNGWSLVAEISIQSFDELHEVLEALMNTKPPDAPSNAFRTVRLSTLVDDVYLPLSARADQRYLVRPQDLRAHFPDDDIEQYVRDELYGLKEDSFRLFQVLSRETSGLNVVAATSYDIVVTRWDCHPVGACKLGHFLFYGFVLRLKPAASLMFMLDLLRHSLEGEQLIHTFTLANSVHDWLKQSTLSVPTDRVSQILHSMVTRHARQEYVQQVQRLSQGREPFKATAELFRKRRDMVSSLHSEMILQVESLVAPLPFFIEYPFARFTGTSDRLQRIRYAKTLLNVICKASVFLPLEELQQLQPKSQRNDAIATKLRGWKALSDGALLDLGKDILDAVNSDGAPIPLPVFGNMCVSTAGWRDVLRPMVAARNRLGHPPFDDGPFLKQRPTFSRGLSLNFAMYYRT